MCTHVGTQPQANMQTMKLYQSYVVPYANPAAQFHCQRVNGIIFAVCAGERRFCRVGLPVIGAQQQEWREWSIRLTQRAAKWDDGRMFM